MPSRKPIAIDPWIARVIPSRGLDAEGRPYWRARAYQDGATTSRARRGTRKQIREWLLGLGDPREARRPTEVQTVGDLLELWGGHTEGAGLAPRTDAAYRGARNRLAGVLGPYPAVQLLRGLPEEYVAQRRHRYAARTIRLDLRCLGVAWTWARRRGLVPAQDLRVPRVNGPPVRSRHTPTAGEVAAAVAALDAAGRPAWNGHMVRLLWALGCRVGELAKLRWSAVHLDAGRVTLAGKTGPRIIDLPAEARAVLSELHAARRDADGFVLGVAPGGVKRGRVTLTAVQRELGQTPWTLQSLRRAKVDRLHRQGVDVAAAAAFLGHSPAVVWSAYRQVSQADLRAVAVADDGRLPRGQVVALRAGGRHSRPEHDDDDEP